MHLICKPSAKFTRIPQTCHFMPHNFKEHREETSSCLASTLGSDFQFPIEQTITLLVNDKRYKPSNHIRILMVLVLQQVVTRFINLSSIPDLLQMPMHVCTIQDQHGQSKA